MLTEKRDTVVDEIMKAGIDIKNRIIYFGENAEDEYFGDVSVSSMEFCIRKFNKLIDDDPTHEKPIYFWVESYGGDAYPTLALYDRIRTCPCPVIFYGYGALMSAITTIMCACDERYLFKNSRIMVHEGSDGAEDRASHFQVTAKENAYINDEFNKIYAENSFVDANTWKELCKMDIYLTAEEAIRLGLADSIVEEPDRTSFRLARLKNSPEPDKIAILVQDIFKRTDRSQLVNLTCSATLNNELAEHYLATSPKKRGRKPKV